MSLIDLRKMTKEEFASKLNIPVEALQHWQEGKAIPNKFEISVLSTLFEYAHTSTKDVCLLGLKLLELKKSGSWLDTINPETNLNFNKQSFDLYCKYTFGFTKTHISNLLRLSKFVYLKENTVEFIDPTYKNYNTSQLIELASINPNYRKYFSPNMSVKNIRDAKKYIKSENFKKDKVKANFDFNKDVLTWMLNQSSK